MHDTKRTESHKKYRTKIKAEPIRQLLSNRRIIVSPLIALLIVLRALLRCRPRTALALVVVEDHAPPISRGVLFFSLRDTTTTLPFPMESWSRSRGGAQLRRPCPFSLAIRSPFRRVSIHRPAETKQMLKEGVRIHIAEPDM